MYSAILSNRSNSDTHSLSGGSWVFRLVLCFLFVSLSVLVSPARLQAQELALPSLDETPPTQDNSFVLGANDKINISVYGEEDLTLSPCGRGRGPTAAGGREGEGSRFSFPPHRSSRWGGGPRSGGGGGADGQRST